MLLGGQHPVAMSLLLLWILERRVVAVADVDSIGAAVLRWLAEVAAESACVLRTLPGDLRRFIAYSSRRSGTREEEVWCAMSVLRLSKFRRQSRERRAKRPPNRIRTVAALSGYWLRVLAYACCWIYVSISCLLDLQRVHSVERWKSKRYIAPPTHPCEDSGDRNVDWRH
jgi:hypothetical protein